MTKPKIQFTAEIVKVQTLADEGIRLTFNLSEDCIPQAAMLMECKRKGMILEFSATIPEETEQKGDNYGL